MADRDDWDRYETEGPSPSDWILKTRKGSGFLFGGNAFEPEDRAVSNRVAKRIDGLTGHRWLRSKGKQR